MKIASKKSKKSAWQEAIEEKDYVSIIAICFGVTCASIILTLVLTEVIKAIMLFLM
jgi:hypothetical protein